MRRRELLQSVGAAAGMSLFPMSSTSEDDDDIVARSRDRVVRFGESDGRSTWTVESRDTGDTVYEFSFPRGLLAHSYVSSDRVFIALDPSAFTARKTFEWFLQGDFGRSRKVQRNGETRIIDYYADGAVIRRV
jgi:hypothetical protein